MRLKMLWLVVFLLCVPCAASAGDDAGLVRVSDGVYAYAGVHSGSPFNRFGANAGIVIGDDSVLVVDTLTSAREAEHFIKDIRKITDKPIKFVVDTHYHLDHALGNCVFADQGAIIIAHKLCGEQLLASGDSTLKAPQAFGLEPGFWDGTRIAGPDITFVKEFDVNLGNMPVRIIHSGFPSHSTGSVMVLVPRQKVLFSGDILFTDFHPFLGEGNMQGWAKTLDLIGSMDVDTIIPGHGPLSGEKDLIDMKEYLVFFDAKARELSATMSDPAQITAEMLKILPKRADGDFIVGMNIGMRYAPKKTGETN